MTISPKFSKSPLKTADTVVFFVHQDLKLSSAGAELNKSIGQFLTHALSSNGKFKGKLGQSVCIHLPENAPYKRAVITGLGKPDEFDHLKAEEAGGKLYLALKSAGAQKVNIFTESYPHAAHIAAGLKLRSYTFETYKKPKDDDKPLSTAHFVSDQKKEFTALDNVIGGVFTARDLVNDAPNALYPDDYAQRIKSALTPLGVKVDILDEKKMKKLGMEAILAVGMGSSRKPRMVIMQWKGAGNAKSDPVALVGKGVTFDTGGISLKPGAGMDEMKMDMGGSAAVVGTMKALASRKSKAHVVGIVGLAENMPGADAYRPGDIIGSYAGKTIEVLNTDAEGRLVLADALAYVQDKYNPKAIIDLATLTGAMMVALGHEYCGTFSTDDALWGNMKKASAKTGEKLWRMPLDKVWSKEMESDVADLRNMGKTRYAGANTAAAFLQHFIKDDTPWAHMDIAGTAWRKTSLPTTPKYGTGFGVRVLDQLITDAYE